jgi:hypothetical protein
MGHAASVAFVRQMLESCANRASVEQSSPPAGRALPPMGRAYAGETKGRPRHQGGQYTRDAIAMGRQQRVPAGSRRD